MSAAGIRNHLDDTTERLAVLRLKGGGLDIHFLEEGQVDTRP
jgi:hypothetical protein